MNQIHKASIILVGISVLISLGIGSIFGSFLLPALILFTLILAGIWLLSKILR